MDFHDVDLLPLFYFAVTELFSALENYDLIICRSRDFRVLHGFLVLVFISLQLTEELRDYVYVVFNLHLSPVRIHL